MFPSYSGTEIKPVLQFAPGTVAARGDRLLVVGRCFRGETHVGATRTWLPGERCFLGDPPQCCLKTENLQSRHRASG